MVEGGFRNTRLYNKQPIISIITVVLNGGNFINDYLQNVTSFLTSEIELIVIDGGSTDKTVEALNKFNHAINYWCSEPDAGIYDAMNKAIKLANGQWLYFMGVDDLLLNGFAEMPALLKQPNAIYYGNVTSYGKLFSGIYNAYFLTKINICHQAIFYPKAVFQKYQYDTRYQICADYHLNLQCWYDTEFTFIYNDKMIASFASGGVSTHTRDLQFEQDRNMLFKKYLGNKAYYRYVNRTKGVLHVIKSMLSA